MTNNLNLTKKSAKIVTSFSFALIIAMALLVSASKANAESPNILVGQDLTLGTSNQNVVVLQGLLSELGYLNIPAGIPFGYYGSMTKNALASYQASLGVTPAIGYFGPVTKVAMHSNFSSHGYLSILGW